MISLDTLNPNVLKAQYAVRGPIVELAQNMEAEGREIFYFNIGNPQKFDQQPLTYVREILSLLNYPKLLENGKKLLDLGYKADSIRRAKQIIEWNPTGLGPYSQSAGMPFIRKRIAEFIHERDNIPTDWKQIFVVDGASKGVDLVLNAIIKDNVGIMTPIPQYPLYSADIALFGGKQIPYYLDEENNWGINLELLENSLQKATKQGIDVKLIVVINPNNPTGTVLSTDQINMVLEFAKLHNLFVIADEVYQKNIYDTTKKFHSFAKVAYEHNINIPIFSLHSTSKGYYGECGYRGGYLELRNIPEDVLAELLKLRSIGLCPNTNGQLSTYLMVTPPKEGDESYELFVEERTKILTILARKAEKIATALNAIEGVSCVVPKGAMYLFPKLNLPDRDYGGKPADFAFCEYLVKETGIVTVPGSGFGQKPNTWHLRMTFLPPEDRIDELLEKFATAYKKFTSQSLQ